MRNEVKLTDAEIESRFIALDGVWLTVADVAFTRDTLDDFKSARKGYSKPGVIDVDDGEDLLIASAQVRSGEPRRRILICDFGTVRGVYRTAA